MTFAEKMIYVQDEGWRTAEELIKEWNEEREELVNKWKQAWLDRDEEEEKKLNAKINICDRYFTKKLREI